MPHVDHPSLSKTHSISFCSLRPPAPTADGGAYGHTVPQSYRKGKRARPRRSHIPPRVRLPAYPTVSPIIAPQDRAEPTRAHALRKT
jgi:hypothetical protein